MQYWDAAKEDWMKQKIQGKKVEKINVFIGMTRNLFSTLDKEEKNMYKEMTEQKEANVPVSNGLMDGQEQTNDKNAKGEMKQAQETETSGEQLLYKYFLHKMNVLKNKLTI